MKRIFFAIPATVLFLYSCQQKPAVVEVNTEAVKVQVTEAMDKYHSAINAKDTSQISLFWSEDLLFLGTDPSEFENKESIMNNWGRAFADTSFSMNLTVDKREVRVAGDGNSAIVVEQFYVALISRKIPVRFVYHLVKSEGAWQIDFASVAMIPKNEDLPSLNKALE